MVDTDNLSDLDVIVRTLDGEAANQGIEGIHGVGSVIQTRVKLNWQEEITARGVCLHHYQFSCWLPGTDRDRIMAQDYVPPSDCIDIANRMINGTLLDITNGATHYFDDSIPPPSWADPSRFTVKIGTLNFYNLSS